MQNKSQNSGNYASSGFAPSSIAAEQSESTEHQINMWRKHIEQCDHSMIVFGSDSRLLELNHVLRDRLSDSTISKDATQSNAAIWRAICETATSYIQEVAAAGGSSIAEVFPVHNKCVAVVGWALRNSRGDFMGAVVKIADLSEQSHRLGMLFDDSETQQSITGSPNLMTEEDADLFQAWVGNREQARRKMKQLSRREYQVVSLVAEGHPNKAIARELELSVKTIEKHRANAVRKLGVSSSCEMVGIAVVAGTRSPIVLHPHLEVASRALCPT